MDSDQESIITVSDGTFESPRSSWSGEEEFVHPQATVNIFSTSTINFPNLTDSAAFSASSSRGLQSNEGLNLVGLNSQCNVTYHSSSESLLTANNSDPDNVPSSSQHTPSDSSSPEPLSADGTLYIPPRKKIAFDFQAVASILTDVEPTFVEKTWAASDGCIGTFNEKVLNFFKTNRYPKIGTIPEVVDLVTPIKQLRVNIQIICECCFDEVQYHNAVECSKELHNFCKDCITRNCECILGNGDVNVKCMGEDCTGTFTASDLESALPTLLFQKLQQKQQISEVIQAKVEGLESCPFCDFAYVPIPTSTVFECMNEECKKDSCRLCKEESHIPLRCGEVESEQNARQKIEEAMTEKLLRQCYQCGKKFVKSDGCNKMLCQCGAVMCYLCRQPVKDYTHFNGQGGQEFWKCPLWTDNQVLHVQDVQEAGRRARDEELVKNPSVQLSYDPTVL